jgi:hypothetical protein
VYAAWFFECDWEVEELAVVGLETPLR